MNSLKETLLRIKEVSSKTTTSISNVVHKLSEEVGEVSAEVLRIEGIKPLKIGEDPVEQLKEEAVDTLITTLDLLHSRLDLSEEDIVKLAIPKINKWESQKHR